MLSHSLSRCSGFVCFSYRYMRQSCLFLFSRAIGFILPLLTCILPPDVRLHKQSTFCPLAAGGGGGLILDLVSFFVFWRTLTPVNVQVCLLDWYYLVPWLWWPEGGAETAVFCSPAWEAGLSVGFCWLSQKSPARADCVFVPGTVCKRQAVPNMLLWSDSGCVWLKPMVFQLRGHNVCLSLWKRE